jgi:RNA polymerase sigma-70 factor (ECF subfamily)
MLADDLTQETIAKGVSRKDQLVDINKLSAWIFRILHNCWMEYLRKYRPTLDIDDAVYVSDREPLHDINQSQIVRTVRGAITELPMGQRQVITLVDLEERRYAEVAEILGIPVGTVMSRLNRARAALKARLSHLNDSSITDRPRLRRVK